MFFKCSLACLSAVVLSACIPLNSGEQLKNFAPIVQGNPQSDYAILPCGNLSKIEGEVLEQLNAAKQNPTTNRGRLGLLQSQLRDVQSAQQVKACAPTRQLATTEIVAKAKETVVTPTQPVRTLAVSAPLDTSRQQQFLQIGTFFDRQNAVAATRHFRSRGFQVQNRSKASSGQSLVRVLIGPLISTEAQASASNAARQYGIEDAFLTVE